MKGELLQLFGDFLGTADADRLNRLADCFTEQVLEPGDDLYAAGDKADRIYFILTGRLTVHHPSGFGGKTQVVAILSGGSVVGESALGNVKNRKATVRAAEETRLAYAQVQDLNSLSERDPALMLTFISRLLAIACLRLRKSSERLALAL